MAGGGRAGEDCHGKSAQQANSNKHRLSPRSVAAAIGAGETTPGHRSLRVIFQRPSREEDEPRGAAVTAAIPQTESRGYSGAPRNHTLPEAPAQLAQSSDIELVDAVLRGTPGAVEAFYRRHSQLIYHCIRARADRQDVDDIFQAFFERLIKREYRVLQLWQRGTSLPMYLAKVIRNFVIDFHRGRRLREGAVGGTTELEPLSGAEAEPTTAASHLKELRQVGIRAWAVLEPRDRKLICDRLHRDLDNDAIARRLQLSAGALRT